MPLVASDQSKFSAFLGHFLLRLRLFVPAFLLVKMPAWVCKRAEYSCASSEKIVNGRCSPSQDVRGPRYASKVFGTVSGRDGGVQPACGEGQATMNDRVPSSYIELTAGIVSAYVSNNAVAAGDIS